MLGDCLVGIRVLDLSQYLPGPFATQLLADLGAEVLKVEPTAGDPMRRFMLADGDGVSPFYKQVNAGKSVVEIDLKKAAGKQTLTELVRAADVLLESYRPGVLERLGFGRERLEQINPRLIHCALSGFGQTGPCRQRAGHDLTYLAMSGMLSLTGTGQTPVIPFPPICDYAAGKQAATSILAALLRRGRTGRGAFIDVSLFEMALSWQSFGLTAACRPGEAFGRGRDLLTGGAACYQVYRTADDRFVALGAIEEKFWRAFCETVGRPDWIARQHEPLPQKELIAELQALFASADRDEWQRRLARVDCCFEPVLEQDEVPGHPHVRQRRLLQIHDRERRIEVLFPAWVDGEPPRQRRPLERVSAAEALAMWKG
ncbi:crotonobetainyl-CoA:carnitine CoA-transferase CaiB-like acyl-CoA transferase [Geothermobacter ehrlichii]|uniref:Crotonobetainyl-CoA:carnitine CoA-transferase CaiB-like acyl-CoA transferase n=1 Tax=Geothermobacter ehrlichii TaxID=213224 RepID=A0A5D3WJB4_9BACT|nr:CoA transferase [Geothermobacter ehrlichii]TYO95768.1 crotonobetainyl-CoA:carnitine CoA-transferase CaiB-like acyl-CoA transferase [Geothermobacter ehrlichii]